MIPAMSTFVLRLKAPRPAFAQTLTDDERAVMGRHAAHWGPWPERGAMVVFGPVLTDDDSYGLAAVETEDEQELRNHARKTRSLRAAPPASRSAGWRKDSSLR